MLIVWIGSFALRIYFYLNSAVFGQVTFAILPQTNDFTYAEHVYFTCLYIRCLVILKICLI